MKSVILAGTLAVLANGAKVSNFDKKLSSVSKRVPREKARTEVKSNPAKTKELQAKMMKEAPMTEEAISKDGFLTEGVATGWKVFEITAGATGCDVSNRDVTFGINMWRCTDAIWKSTDPGGEDIGYAESYIYYYAGNGGFPKIAFFDGHGCDWNNLYWIDRVYKTDFGFPMNYKPCNIS
jgi:hypothetical protein